MRVHALTQRVHTRRWIALLSVYVVYIWIVLHGFDLSMWTCCLVCWGVCVCARCLTWVGLCQRFLWLEPLVMTGLNHCSRVGNPTWNILLSCSAFHQKNSANFPKLFLFTAVHTDLVEMVFIFFYQLEIFIKIPPPLFLKGSVVKELNIFDENGRWGRCFYTNTEVVKMPVLLQKRKKTEKWQNRWAHNNNCLKRESQQSCSFR